LDRNGQSKRDLSYLKKKRFVPFTRDRGGRLRKVQDGGRGARGRAKIQNKTYYAQP